MPEALLDRFSGVWEYSVLVRIVGPPHDVVDSYAFNLVQRNEFLLERRITLPFPVVGRSLRKSYMEEAVLVFVVSAFKDVGQPPDAALP